ncbi:MAG: exported protein of unknown function [Clostridia bacterium]|jgi:hypothetical protein|nr:exported protein of unknown function [Clostridia bacterium]
MMKNVLKKLLSLALVGTSVFTFSGILYAQESLTEASTIDVVVTEEVLTEETTAEETFPAVVTLSIGDEYKFALNENGAVVLIEGANEELIATLLKDGKTLSESIQAIVATYGEEAIYSVAVTSSDEALAAAITESLKEVVQQEVETEISNRPEFITKRFTMAKALGITPGKMHLLEKLAAVIGEEINYEEWSQKLVKEVMSEIKANKVVKTKNNLLDQDTQSEAKVVASHKNTVEVKTEKSKTENSQGQSQSSSQGSSHGNGKNK